MAISDDRAPVDPADGSSTAYPADDGSTDGPVDATRGNGGETTAGTAETTAEAGTGEAGVDAGGPPAYDGWRGHLRYHRVHVAVILAFLVYPFVYSFLTTAPAVGTTFDLFLPDVNTMVFVIVIGLFAMSFDFISGYTGYLSFGHALFYGIGAYFVIMAANDLIPLMSDGTPFLFLILWGAILATAAGLVVGLVSFRLTGVYFAMLTLGFAELANLFIRDWSYLGLAPESGIDHGAGFSLGLPYAERLGELGVPAVEHMEVHLGQLVGDSFHSFFGLAGMAESTARSTVSFYAIGVLVIVCYFAMQRVIHSPFGKVMVAIRENEERARAVGYNTYWYKLSAFSISAFFAGVAGALAAGYRRGASPDNSFDLFVTADALLAAIIGGFGTLAGSLYGHLFHEALDDLLSTESHGLARYLRGVIPEDTLETELFADLTLEAIINALLAGRAELYLGLVFVFFVLVVPRGLLGTLRDRLGGTAAEKLPAHLGRYVRGLRK